MSISARVLSSLGLLAGLGLGIVACTAPSDSAAKDEEITSNDGVPLEMSFTAQVTTTAEDTPRRAIATQLQYVIGALTSAEQANAQAHMPALSNITEVVSGDKKTISYDAALTVIWQKGRAVPTTYGLTLPKDVTRLAEFNAKYVGTCGTNEYGAETFWHDFNPNAASCKLDNADLLRVKTSVKSHPLNGKDKYPEYDQIWADDTLDMVAVYGIISANTPDDQGAVTREMLIRNVSSTLSNVVRTENPIAGSVIHDSSVSGTIVIAGKKRKVNLTAMLVQEVSSAGPAFNSRWSELTAKADYITYEGHSGLGKNINALARNTGVTAGKYQLVYFYGCQTLSYLEPTMHEKRIALNGAALDPDGTKYLDIIATALPAYGDDARSATAVYEALLDTRAPKTFNDLLKTVSPLHLAVVFGEHDNTFKP